MNWLSSGWRKASVILNHQQLKIRNMKKTILLMAVCLCFIGKASAQWVVSDPGNLAQGIINTTKQIVQTSTTAKNTLDGFMEAQKIFQQGTKYYDGAQSGA